MVALRASPRIVPEVVAVEMETGVRGVQTRLRNHCENYMLEDIEYVPLGTKMRLRAHLHVEAAETG